MNDSTWTWMSGNDTFANLASEFGPLNTPCTNCFPASRVSAIGWFDGEDQEFWVFGGRGYNQDGKLGAFIVL